MDIQKTCKLLRYALQFIIIYLVLRYLPQINMDTKSAGITALILIFLCVILEFLYSKMLVITEETFDAGDCNTCNMPVETFVGATEPLYNTGHTMNSIPQKPTTPTTLKTIPQLNEVAHEKPMAMALQTAATPKVHPPSQEVRAMQEIHPMSDMRPLVNPRVADPHIPSKIPMAGQQVKEEQVDYVGMGTTMDVTPFYLVPHDKAQDKEVMRDRQEAKTREEVLEESSRTLGLLEQPYQIPGKKSEKNIAPHYNPVADGYVLSDYQYSDFDHNFLPIARGYKTDLARDYGYSYIPPEGWYPTPPRAPVCVTTNNREPVMPSWSDGPTDLKDFSISNRITGPMGISTKYIEDKLNAGR